MIHYFYQNIMYSLALRLREYKIMHQPYGTMSLLYAFHAHEDEENHIKIHMAYLAAHNISRLCQHRTRTIRI